MNQQEEHKKEHLIAVVDCIKAKKLLAGFGIAEHQIVLENPADVFDSYYNCDIETLHIEHESLCNQASKFAYDLHLSSPQEKTIYRELREDEMDTED